MNGYREQELLKLLERITTALEQLVELKQKEQKTPEQKKLEKLMKDRLNVVHGALYPYSEPEPME